MDSFQSNFLRWLYINNKKIIAYWIPLWKIVVGVPDKVNKEYISFLAPSNYISDKLL